jgi:hypothetical protein
MPCTKTELSYRVMRVDVLSYKAAIGFLVAESMNRVPKVITSGGADDRDLRPCIRSTHQCFWARNPHSRRRLPRRVQIRSTFCESGDVCGILKVHIIATYLVPDR